MLNIEVTYFLNAAGREYFPDWFDEVFSEAQKQEGFINMSYTPSDDAPVVLLNFENRCYLDQWIIQERHDQLAAKIEGFCIKPKQVLFR